jgi:hypothetical protein
MVVASSCAVRSAEARVLTLGGSGLVGGEGAGLTFLDCLVLVLVVALAILWSLITSDWGAESSHLVK